MLKSEVKKYGNNLAILSDNCVELKYDDLIYQSNVLLNYVIERSLIFTLCENSVGALIGYYTFLNGKHVQLLLDATLSLTQIENLVLLYKPNYLWVPNSLKHDSLYENVVYSNWNYSLIRVNESKILMYDELSLLLTTSGTTGSPKFVRLSLSNLISNAKSIANYLNITEADRPITSLPMNYSYGLSVINSHLIKGATILLTNFSVVQKEFWDFAKKQKATSIAGVPYTYQMLRMLRFSTMELPYLRTLTQAGGKLPSNLIKEYIEYALKYNKKFIVMYGQTEATARMSYLPFNNCIEKIESIGIPIPGGKFSLIDLAERNEIKQSNIHGELIYEGPNVSLGYAENISDLQKGDENCGKLYTGDLAYKDDDGYYFITGRIKRFIKIFGNRVNLDDIEQIILNNNIECACGGIDDKLIVFTTAANKSEEIIYLLTSKLKLNSRAFAVHYISEIPKNSAGKVLYKKLNELYK